MALAAAVGMMIAAVPSRAQIVPAILGSTGISWDDDPEALLVSYRDIWGEVANQDPTPLIRLFGDGRVLVHYPAYTPKAGDYELWLQPKELEDLLLSLVAKSLATFEPESVGSLKGAEERRRWEAALDAGKSPELFMVADDSTSVFELHLTGYQPAGAARAASEVKRGISSKG